MSIGGFKLTSESELEDLLHAHIELLNPNWLVIGRQITMPSGKRIDLLCMDQDGDLIVVELKKELTPREVTAQAIDYAASVLLLQIKGQRHPPHNVRSTAAIRLPMASTTGTVTPFPACL